MSFRLLPQAEADIASISVYIACDSKAAAHRWAEMIFAQCKQLADIPELGVARDEIRPGLRMMPTGNYVILYRRSSDASRSCMCWTAAAHGRICSDPAAASYAPDARRARLSRPAPRRLAHAIRAIPS
ncbi:type II toxin-antitoxin system RelE/ParE family toxin [Bosea sp. (in: a-proteobacteria)]|uniref:type II toxin-antitoxin system RelE/ParE family toxin n=1 Tax=Bosea sp. (in: a-proteobacteria) TaxID=1871050 RepID=UPI0031FECCC5